MKGRIMNEIKKTQKCARRAVNFELREAPGHEVMLAGSFNDWHPERPMCDKNGDGVYRCRLLLTPGVYHYKFLIDGNWRLDPANPNFQPNGFGSLNNVLEVTEK